MLGVETEQEREVTQQLKQANDTVSRLQDELSIFKIFNIFYPPRFEVSPLAFMYAFSVLWCVNDRPISL